MKPEGVTVRQITTPGSQMPDRDHIQAHGQFRLQIHAGLQIREGLLKI